MSVPADQAMLLDTNILVYAHDASAGEKRKAAAALIADLVQSGRLIVSAQVLNELFSVLLRRGGKMGVDLAKAASIVRDLANIAQVLPLNASTSKLAINAVVQHTLSFWDALVWAAAFENNIHVVISEDFQTGRELDGVRFVNPFLPAA